MNELKKLNKKQVAKNAYRMIIESNYSIESVALSLDISERLIYYGKHPRMRVLFVFLHRCSVRKYID